VGQEIETRICKACLLELCRSVVTKPELSNTLPQTAQSCQFFNRYLFRSSPMVMNLG